MWKSQGPRWFYSAIRLVDGWFRDGQRPCWSCIHDILYLCWLEIKFPLLSPFSIVGNTILACVIRINSHIHFKKSSCACWIPVLFAWFHFVVGYKSKSDSWWLKPSTFKQVFSARIQARSAPVSARLSAPMSSAMSGSRDMIWFPCQVRVSRF